jgi:uncharacterized protein YceK
VGGGAPKNAFASKRAPTPFGQKQTAIHAILSGILPTNKGLIQRGLPAVRRPPLRWVVKLGFTSTRDLRRYFKSNNGSALMKLWTAALMMATLSGCGTIKTLIDEKGAADTLARHSSNCQSIPRAYSGAVYQFCTLNGPPVSGPHWSAPTIALDMALSAVADTVLLPYTGYQQYQQGDIKVRRKQY